MTYFYLSIAGILTYVFFAIGFIAISVVFLYLIRNSNRLAEQVKLNAIPLRRELGEERSLQGVIVESADNISNLLKRAGKIYSNAINGLATQDSKLLKNNKKGISKLSDEIDDLSDHIYYFIKHIDTPSVSANDFYISILESLKDINQSLEYISKVSFKHVKEKRKKLKFNQIKELKEINEMIEEIFEKTQKTFKNYTFENTADILTSKEIALDLVTQKTHEQIERTHSDESSPKSATLYFNLLLETRALLETTMNLLNEYRKAHDKSVSPAVVMQAVNESAEQ